MNNQSYSFEGAGSPASYSLQKSPDDATEASLHSYGFGGMKQPPQRQHQQSSRGGHGHHGHQQSLESTTHWRWVNEEEEMDDEILPWQDDGIETNNHELSSNDVVLCTHLLESFARRGYLLQPFVDGAYVDGVSHWRLAPRKDLAHRPLQGKRRNPVLLTYPPAPPTGGQPEQQFQSPGTFSNQGSAGQYSAQGQQRQASFPNNAGTPSFAFQDRFHDQSAANFHESAFFQTDAPTPASGSAQQDKSHADTHGDFLQPNMLSPFDNHADGTAQPWSAQTESVHSPPSNAPASHLLSMFGANGASTSGHGGDMFASIASPAHGLDSVDYYQKPAESPALFKTDATSPAESGADGMPR
jgi:hypothetical protein